VIALVGTGAVGAALRGASVALSGDGNTAIVGGCYDNSGTRATWVFAQSGGVWSQQQFLQLGEVRRHAEGLVAGEPVGRRTGRTI
jgi:hypothetical protein